MLGDMETLLGCSTTSRRLVMLLCHLAHDLKVIVDDVHCAPFLFISLLPAFLLEERRRCESFDINGCDLGRFKFDSWARIRHFQADKNLILFFSNAIIQRL